MENFCKRISLPLARFSIFLVYFWFGALKVFCDYGAANPMVVALLDKTMSFIPPALFLIGFGAFEMVIGLTFLIPQLNRIGLVLLTFHLFATITPLILLPHLTWQGFLVPTLEGQYIIKNILIVALAVAILSHTHHLEAKEKNV